MRILTKNWQLLRKKRPHPPGKGTACGGRKIRGGRYKAGKAAAFFAQAEQLATAGQWGPLYDLLTPYVLGMEEAPG